MRIFRVPVRIDADLRVEMQIRGAHATAQKSTYACRSHLCQRCIISEFAAVAVSAGYKRMWESVRVCEFYAHEYHPTTHSRHPPVTAKYYFQWLLLRQLAHIWQHDLHGCPLKNIYQMNPLMWLERDVLHDFRKVFKKSQYLSGPLQISYITNH